MISIEKKNPTRVPAKKAAEMIGVGTWTLWDWRRRNFAIPYRKIGGRFYYDLADIHDLIENGRVEPSD